MIVRLLSLTIFVSKVRLIGILSVVSHECRIPEACFLEGLGTYNPNTRDLGHVEYDLIVKVRHPKGRTTHPGAALTV